LFPYVTLFRSLVPAALDAQGRPAVQLQGLEVRPEDPVQPAPRLCARPAETVPGLFPPRLPSQPAPDPRAGKALEGSPGLRRLSRCATAGRPGVTPWLRPAG